MFHSSLLTFLIWRLLSFLNSEKSFIIIFSSAFSPFSVASIALMLKLYTHLLYLLNCIEGEFLIFYIPLTNLFSSYPSPTNRSSDFLKNQKFSFQVNFLMWLWNSFTSHWKYQFCLCTQRVSLFAVFAFFECLVLFLQCFSYLGLVFYKVLRILVLFIILSVNP